MGDTFKDPVDHSRTTRPLAGEALKDGTNFPGLILMAVGLVVLVISLTLFGTGNASAGIIAAIVAVLLLAGGVGWLILTHQRVRRRHHRWRAKHPEAPTPPLTS